jgi:CheY-like chemotaxis protein
MLSSACRRSNRDRSRELGIAAYLTKPVKQSELLDAILNAVGDGVNLSPQPPPRSGEGEPKSSSPLPEAGRGVGEERFAPLRILLAEDNPVNQKLALRLLERKGHSVVVAQNGRVAVEAWKAQPFDLIVMDVQMPEMGGYEATSAIRAAEQPSQRHIPILAMTAHAMKGDRERCLEAGMDDYVSKPIQAAALYEAIDRLGALIDAHSSDEMPAVRTTLQPGEIVGGDDEAVAVPS